MIQAYCLKCRTKREMKNPQEIEFRGKGNTLRRALTSKCPVCGRKLFKILPKIDIEKEIIDFDKEQSVK
mgnify:CR=1 FL=1